MRRLLADRMLERVRVREHAVLLDHQPALVARLVERGAEPGEVHVAVADGAGISKHIVGLLEPDSGEVEVFGQDIWRISEKERYELRKRFGVLFQDGALFGSMNIYDNVAFPLRKHTDKREDEIREIVMDRTSSEVGLDARRLEVPRRDLRAACGSAPASRAPWCSSRTS